MSKKFSNKDPYAKRESEKYAMPIASREHIMALLEQAGTPLKREQIADQLGMQTDDQLFALKRRLRAMERDGQILYTRKGGYGLAHKMDMVRGRVQGHPDGFGFLIPDEGGDDLFLSARDMRQVFHGDRVMACVAGEDKRGRKMGRIVEVLERANLHVVGRLFIEAGVGFVIPDNKRISHDILIARENFNGATHGQIVSVEIIEQPTSYRQAMGSVVEILGEHMAPGMEIDIAVRAHDLPHIWPEKLQQAVSKISPEVNKADFKHRVDIRDLPLVTIDGEDARDFDDAVYCQRHGRGWRLLVAIADVSHYVAPDSELDREAQLRGNSVYFPEQVIPMLPEVLSNGLCSLNPQVDRLCMVCDMMIGETGILKDSKFYPAVMYSHARLTYTKVASMLVEKDKSLHQQYAALLPHLMELHALYKVMRKQRSKRGAIDFETTETRIVFGEQRKIEKIIPVVRNDAHKMIEECMITANVATANYLLAHEIPALYRIHEGPTGEKLEDLRSFLSELGLQLQGGLKPKAKDYAGLIAQIESRPDRHLIQTVMLRSLRQAVYQPDNVGHFGLAYEAYTHFTSPIRRYPDLLVHRAIKHLFKKGTVKGFRYSINDMQRFGDECSQTERRADEATRDVVDWLKCEYMLDKVGEVYAGTISSVTGFGIFVELDDIYVEGLVHVTSLDSDYYHFDHAHHRLVGERTSQIYRLGDRVKVSVARVDLDDRKIDFDISESSSRTKSASKEKRARKKTSARHPARNSANKKTTRRRTSKKKTDNRKAEKNKTGKKKPSKNKTTGKKIAANKNTLTKSKKKRNRKKQTRKK